MYEILKTIYNLSSCRGVFSNVREPRNHRQQGSPK